MTESNANKNSLDFATGQEFMHLYVASERRIRAYIYTLVHNWSATEDLLQETAKVMWVKFSEFERGSDFAAWGLTIARFHVLNFIRRSDQHTIFNTDLIEKLSDQAQIYLKDDRRCEALRLCVAKLDEDDRQLIVLRYEIGATVKDVAQRVGRGVKRVYHSLNRIHYQLSLCVKRTLVMEDKR